jgi:transcriptional regulator with XRE-family HTH domain
MDAQFQTILKEWRGLRRMSQMELGLTANVSARHVAFLETGRSKPSRAMVIQLAEALGVPRSDRNRMLNAAGFAPAYHTRSLSEPDMAPVQQAIAWMIAKHDPYPAFVVDRHWRLVSLNASGARLFGALGLTVGASLIDAMLDPAVGAVALENWTEVAYRLLVRLRTESAHLGGDPTLDNAAARLAADPAVVGYTPPTPLPAIIPAKYRLPGGATLSFISTIAQFGTAEDIALSDLRIELFFPADDQTRLLLEHGL